MQNDEMKRAQNQEQDSNCDKCKTENGNQNETKNKKQNRQQNKQNENGNMH